MMSDGPKVWRPPCIFTCKLPTRIRLSAISLSDVQRHAKIIEVVRCRAQRTPNAIGGLTIINELTGRPTPDLFEQQQIWPRHFRDNVGDYRILVDAGEFCAANSG